MKRTLLLGLVLLSTLCVCIDVLAWISPGDVTKALAVAATSFGVPISLFVRQLLGSWKGAAAGLLFGCGQAWACMALS